MNKLKRLAKAIWAFCLYLFWPQKTDKTRYGELKKRISDLIEMEHRSCSMDVISPLYVSRMLNVPLEDVEKYMKEMGL